MQHIEVSTVLPGWVAILSWIGVAIFFLLSLYFIIRYMKTKRERHQLISYLLMIPMGFFLFMSLFAEIDNISDQREAFGEEIAAKYGLSFTEDELNELEYPKNKPTAEFEVFGSLEQTLKVDGELQNRMVYLIWEDGEFYLAQSAIDDLTELEAQR